MTRLLGSLTALNSVWFAVMHICWALGWRWGIPDSMPSVNQRPWFLVYDVAAGVLILGLAVMAARVARRPVRASGGPTRLLLLVAAVVCACRGVPGVVGDVITVTQGTLALLSALADTWFVVTAALATGIILTTSRRKATPTS